MTSCTCGSAQAIRPSPRIYLPGALDDIEINGEIRMNFWFEDFVRFIGIWLVVFFGLGGDPAADSPTATLLRLNPPCKIQVRTRHVVRALTHTSLGWFDGRCVQGAGTYSPRYIETRLLRIPASRGRVTALDPNYGWVCEITNPFRGRDPLSHSL